MRRLAVTKTELVNSMAEKAGLSKTDAEKALKAFIDSVTETLQKEDKISLVGFGTFSVGDRAARTGKNPQTGAALQIPAAKVPKFKAGKALKDAVNS
ncbi:MAG: HU family DNA-binding protein [Desulfuromonadaceae bacterium]|nr:HU family DNA-binding protein [Desulfuromonadaceae bacterium]